MAISDKVVLITGASGGIGTSIAVHLASIGYKKLALVARREKELNEVAAKCKENGAESVLVLIHDLQTEDGNRLSVEKSVSEFGHLDILIVNAGIAIPASVRDMTAQDWDTTMGINLKSCFLLTKYSLPHLEKTKGNIVYNSSFLGTTPMSYCANYCSSKAALNMFARCVAKEEASKGIRVNVVAPGFIVDEMTLPNGVPSEILKEAKTKEERFSLGRKHMAHLQPLGRVGEVDEIAKLFAFIISDDNSFMTGSVVRSDGGASLEPPAI